MREVKLMHGITRQFVREHSEWCFLFGDNLQRIGFGGQAKEMRGEPNAIGIPVKKKPTMHDDAFFHDDEFWANARAIDAALDLVPKDGIVIIPADGIGTGLAQLEYRAPVTFKYLKARLKQLVYNQSSKNEHRRNVDGQTKNGRRMDAKV